MRYLALSLVVAALFAATACASKSSSNGNGQSASSTSSDQMATEAPSSAATEAPSEAPTEAATESATAAAGEFPSYPGAYQQAAGSSTSMGKTESGTVLSTDDSFDKVYSWYQQHLPAGAEKAHTAMPQSAVFTVGDPSTGMKSVTITVSEGRTMITIGTVKT